MLRGEKDRTPTEPGWYPNPDDAETLRWWNGKSWETPTFRPDPRLALEPDPPPAHLVEPNGSSQTAEVEPEDAAPVPVHLATDPSSASQWWRSPRVVGPIGVVTGVLVGAVAIAIVSLGSSDEPELRFKGNTIDQPDKTLSAAEDNLGAIVEARHGATVDETRCYFSLPDTDTSTIADRLRCGPVLFFEGDPAAVYMTFPLVDSPVEDSGAVHLTAADQPSSPDPTPLEPDEVLRRPDGKSPPEDDGDIEVPQPPRAEPGLVEVRSLEDVELAAPETRAIIGTFGVTYGVLGVGQPDTVGHGDDAARPAAGERFIALSLQVGPGESGTVVAPATTIQVDVADPRPLPPEIGTVAGPVGLLISVPEDSEVVDLVVSELGFEQRLSLLPPVQPSTENIAVLGRQSRGQQLDASANLVFTGTAPGYAPANFTLDVTIPRADLMFFTNGDGSQHPADPSRAYLVLQTSYVWDLALGAGPELGLDPTAFSLILPDGTVVPAVNLDATGLIRIGFDVPADFTSGTLVVGGAYTDQQGVTYDFGAAQLTTPVEIPLG
jgi:hypothetical protein